MNPHRQSNDVGSSGPGRGIFQLLAVLAAVPAALGQLAPVAEYSVRDANLDGIPDFILGSLIATHPGTGVIADEVFIEFDISGQLPAVAWEFRFIGKDFLGVPGDGLMTFEVAVLPDATGVPRLNGFGQGLPLSIQSFTTPFISTETFRVDATTRVNEAIMAGRSHFAFRIHTPADGINGPSQVSIFPGMGLLVGTTFSCTGDLDGDLDVDLDDLLRVLAAIRVNAGGDADGDGDTDLDDILLVVGLFGTACT